MITKDFITKQKDKIEKKIKFLQKEISEERKYQDLGSTDEDKAKEFEDLEERVAFIKSAESEIKNLNKALKKIERGEYGKCRVCGEIIEKKRLEIYPEAQYCATHAKEDK